MSLQTLKNSLLNKSIIINSTDPDLMARANETAETLINRSYRDKRTDDQIRIHSLEGTIREFAIAQLTGGEINSQTPDFVTFDRNTFGWDVLAHDLYLEIKPQSGSNFNISERTKKTLINNADYYHVIVTVDIKQIDKVHYKVTPMCIITSDNFVKHHKASQYLDKFRNKTYYYSSTSPCIKLNEVELETIEPTQSKNSETDEYYIVNLPVLDSYESETITTIFSRHYPHLTKDWVKSNKRLKIVEGDKTIATIESYNTIAQYANGRFKNTIIRDGKLWFPSYILSLNNLLVLYDDRFAQCKKGRIQVKGQNIMFDLFT